MSQEAILSLLRGNIFIESATSDLFTRIRIFSCLLISLIYADVCAQGLVFDDAAYKASPVKAQLMRGDYTVPTSASLKVYSPRPSHQLDYGTSVAWAVAWQARAILYAREHNVLEKEKDQYIFSPAYVYQKARAEDDLSCSQGITIEAGLKAIKDYGVPLFNDYVYFCGENPSEDVEIKAKEFTISDYSKIFSLDDVDEHKVTLVKKTLSEGWPVVIGMFTPPSFRRAKGFWQPTEIPSNNFPGQALCVVGYDDNMHGGAFEVANSWGGNWGNNGFMWIRYSNFTEFVKYAYEVFVAPKEKPYQLKGSVKFQLSSKEKMPVKAIENGRYIMENTYRAGDQFQVFVNNDDPAFVYVFGSDLTNECFQIFPHKRTVSAALTYRSNHLAIPDEQHFIEFDENSGTDFLCVLYSKEELDIESIIKRVEKSTGPFHQRIKSTLGENLLNKNVGWLPDEVAFNAQADDGAVVAVVVEINHK